ncbi:hypothetical protein L21SP2_2655 [Salinispira pacifica]|uniref:Uncharacterized protein n=1 Tax=Salinispira pacifica TaxID=1307761 RepID=V5WJQ1_9SPIO|nr:hypothetical protein L21SP2_2655 [Salinispira pacifica]
MTKGKWDPVLLTEIGYPIPAEHAFDTNDDIRTEPVNNERQLVWCGRMVSVVMDFSG